MSQRFAFLSATCATSILALVGSAFAQYTTGFETSNGINASPGGTSLTGQDGFYVPSGIDYWAMTYAGNVFGIAANPQGGAQFAVGQGQASPNFSRGQRDITWPAPLATMAYDVACLYTGAPPASNNLGSFSLQPYPGSASAIHLFSFPDLNNPTVWQAGYLAYDANGVALLAPGAIPGPEWSSLTTNHWYRFQTKVDFTTNQMVEASITDLTTNQTTTAALSGVYLEGGSAGGRPAPTGFRMFSGGGLAGNLVAFDNLSITATSGGNCSDFGITQGGSCPGPMTITWSNAPVGATKRVIYTSSGGSGGVIPPGNPCAGTTICIGLAGVTLHPNSLPGTANGTSPNFNAPCGTRVQLITQGGCDVSNAIVLQ